MSGEIVDTTDGRPVLDQRIVSALSHPLRVAILEFLHGGVSSPNGIAKGVREPLSRVAYHVQVLLEVEAIEFVTKKRRRGTWEHFYVTSPRAMIGNQDWRHAPLAVKPGVTNEAVRHFVTRLAAAMDAGTIDRRDDTILTWMPLTLDPRGWREATALLGRAQELLARIQSRSCARLGDTAGIPVIAGLAAFEAAPFEDAPANESEAGRPRMDG